LVRPTYIKPPFTEETAKAKVKAAQDAWNTCIFAGFVTIAIFLSKEKFAYTK